MISSPIAASEPRTTRSTNRVRTPRVLRRVGVAALAVTLLAGAAAPATAAARPDRPELQAAIQSIVDQGFAGTQMRVRDQRGEWVGSAGVSKLGEPAKPATYGRFRVGSATKAFTATVALQLVAAGQVGLDTPAADYLPGYGLDRRITVRMLLQHTSGLFNFTGEFYPDRFEPGIPVTGEEWVDNRFHVYPPAELARFALAKPTRFEPGTGWSYANTNYVLIRLLIEKVTGHSYVDEVKRRILWPLKLWGTEAPELWSTEILGPHAHGYYRYEDASGQKQTVDVSRQNPSWLSNGGDMISTTQDLSTFLAALLGGKLLPAPLLAQMLTPYPTSGYGFGLTMMAMGPSCGGTLVAISGFINGYGQLTYSTLDGRKTLSASVTTGDKDVDLIPEGAKAVQKLLKAEFCTG
ncbi:serine hydrolase domain-containing protein [Actinocrispum wychmicini]|uniref:serine hydrolase domain-containing protein n=1 Tax=Actinocrispum wychmicini TaxID=1213861 RepID=UPI001FB5E0DE|nr:serine hydrolase domain-containing protein [Actinocrispum wychmicini]